MNNGWYSLERFQQFLRLRQIKRVPLKRNRLQYPHDIAEESSSPNSDEDLISSDPFDEATMRRRAVQQVAGSTGVGEQAEDDPLNFGFLLTDFLGEELQEATANPDLFYSARQRSITHERDASDDAFFKYEEIVPSGGELARNTSSECSWDNWNGLTCEAKAMLMSHPTIFEVDSRSFESNPDPLLFPQKNPSILYDDPLQLQPIGIQELQGLSNSRHFKNNLSTLIDFEGLDTKLLMMGCNSDLLFFELNGVDRMPLPNPILRLDSTPAFTTRQDILSAVLRSDPHTINSVKSCSWFGKPILAACIDDGSIKVWFTKTIHDLISNRAQNPRGSFSLRVAPDFLFKLEASAWSVDFASCSEGVNRKQCHIAVGSSNARKINLFFYEEQQNTFHEIDSHEILHNIPEVNIIKYSIKGPQHVALVSCTSISGEVIVFRFQFEVEISNSATFKSEQPEVLSRTQQSSYCWTAKPINKSFFKSVNSLRAMTASSSSDEKLLESALLKEEKVFSNDGNRYINETLSGSHYYRCPVLKPLESQSRSSCEPFADVDERYKRIHRLLRARSGDPNAACASLNDYFLAVSTQDRVGLFRADTLHCNSDTGFVFDFELPGDEDSVWTNRISITILLPRLLAWILVSQQGLVSIFRLCEFKGVYGIRQEHIFPNGAHFAFGEASMRTLIGASTFEVSTVQEYPRYVLHIIYSDGLCIGYEIKDRVPCNHESEMLNLEV